MAMLVNEGVIRADESYTLREFKVRTGMKDGSIRAARQAGLPMRRVGVRTYILGADWLRFLETSKTVQ